MRSKILAGLLAVASAATATSVPPGQESYRRLASLPLPDGRWDLLSVDSAHNRVLIARSDSVTSVDLAKSEATTVGSIAGGHAAVAIGRTDIVAVTSGRDDSVRLINTHSGEQTAQITVGDNPDAAFYDAGSKRLIVMNAESGTVSIIDPQTARVVSTIMVKPALELGTLISKAVLAINDEETNEIELVDLKHERLMAPIALPGCEGPTGIAFDKADGLLLSACANGQAALVDVRSRQLLQLLPIGKGPDGAMFDIARRRFLVPCGQSGTLSVFGVGKARQVKSLGTIQTEVGARTAALDPRTGRVYLPAAKFSPAAAGARPSIIAGSAHLIVLEPLPRT